MSYAEFCALWIFCAPAVRVSCVVYFLGLQTKSAEISYTVASVTGHLPMYFCLKMQAVALSDFYRMWTDIFTGGSLPNCVRNLIGTMNTEFDLGKQSTHLTFYNFRHRIP
jgi:hypothetical protein